MKYTINTYQEEYIVQQFKIGSAQYDKWRMGGQTRPEQLKSTYASDSFDPETKFYAFFNNEMVGFLTASEKEQEDMKTAYFEFPFVENGHEEAVDLLITHAIQKLKTKGYKLLISRAGHYWGKSLELALKHGFFHSSDIVRAGEVHLDEYDVSELNDPTDLMEYNYERDIGELAKAFAERFNVPIENMRQNLSRFKDLKVGETIKNPWDQELTLISNVVGRVDGKLVARAVAMNVEAYGNKNVCLISFYVKDGFEQLKSQLIRRIVEEGKKLGYHRLIVNTGLWGSHPDDSYFEPFGFKFYTKLSYYHKNL